MEFLFVLFTYICLFAYCCLNEKQINKQDRYYKRRINSLSRRIKDLENNQDMCFEYMNDIYSDLESGKHEKKM